MIDIAESFQKGNKKALIGFLTAGDPSAEATARYLKVMQDSGVDLIELGIPFSDPVAEGEVIQSADLRALQGGMTAERVFGLAERVEKRVPFVLMTYANPVFFYGYERFFRRCAETGIGGIIIPDMPFEESGEAKRAAAGYGVTVIDMVAPTSKARIAKVCARSRGFVYLVSSLGVTGVRSRISTDIASIVRQVKGVTDTPVCVGFGISSPEQARAFAQVSDGVIVGSAIVKIIAEYGDCAEEKLREYLTAMAEAVHSV